MSFNPFFINKALNGNSYGRSYLAHKQDVMKLDCLHAIQNDFSFENECFREG